MFGESLLADRDETVKFRVMGDEKEVELGNVIERVRFVDFDFGTEEEVDMSSFEGTYQSRFLLDLSSLLRKVLENGGEG